MASTCRLFAFCFLVFSAASAFGGTQPARSANGIIIASAQVSRPIGLTEISAQREEPNSSPAISPTNSSPRGLLKSTSILTVPPKMSLPRRRESSPNSLEDKMDSRLRGNDKRGGNDRNEDLTRTHVPSGSLWYLHAVRTESVLFELSISSTHLLLESSRLVSLNRELAALAVSAVRQSATNDVIISITTIAD